MFVPRTLLTSMVTWTSATIKHIYHKPVNASSSLHIPFIVIFAFFFKYEGIKILDENKRHVKFKI